MARDTTETKGYADEADYTQNGFFVEIVRDMSNQTSKNLTNQTTENWSSGHC